MNVMMIDDACLNISLQTLATLTTQAEPLFVRSLEGLKAVLFMVLLTAQGLRAYYFTGDLTRLFMLSFHRVAAYIIHHGMAFLCTAAAQLYANVKSSGPACCSLSGVPTTIPLLLPSQAKREEAISIPAQFKDRPGSHGGRRPEYCYGLR